MLKIAQVIILFNILYQRTYNKCVLVLGKNRDKNKITFHLFFITQMLSYISFDDDIAWYQVIIPYYLV